MTPRVAATVTTMMDHLDPIAAGQVDAVVSLAHEVLGSTVVGCYLFGSAVRGGLRPDSDLDVLVVVDRGTTADERRALIGGLLGRSRSQAHRERRHLEVTVVVLPEIRPWHYPPPMELQYGDWWRTEFEAGDLAPWTSPNPDLAVVLTTGSRRQPGLGRPACVGVARRGPAGGPRQRVA